MSRVKKAPISKPATVDTALSTSADAVEEKEKVFNKLLLEDAVPNCPICGKVLHTQNVLCSFKFLNVFKVYLRINKIVTL